MNHLSQRTQALYEREMKRVADFGIKIPKRRGKKSDLFFKQVVSKYKNEGQPVAVCKIAIFALRALGPAWIKSIPLDRDQLGRLFDEFDQPGPKDNDETRLSWPMIVTATRPIIENEQIDPVDRFVLAINTFLPPRRSDIWNLNREGSRNRLDLESGDLSIQDYKTCRKYGPFNVCLFRPGIFWGEAEADRFREICSKMEQVPFKCSSMQSYAGKVAAIFSRYIGSRCSILDLRRAFDAHVRQYLSNPRIAREQRERIKDVLALYTAHSSTMSEFYADKVDLS